MLRPALDGGGDPRGVELQRDLVDDLLEVGVAGRRAGRDQAHDLRSTSSGAGSRTTGPPAPSFTVAMPSRCASGANTSSVSRAFLACFSGAQEAHRAHVVQPVRQLDHQDARVAGHRDDHLADRLGLGRVAELDLVQLGDAVDQVRDLVAEVGAQPLQRVVGVLDGVVQQRRDQRRRVHAELGEDRRDGERVRDVRVAGLAVLALVLLLGDVVGALQQHQVGLGVQRRGAPRPAAPAPACTIATRCGVIRRAIRARTRRVADGRAGSSASVSWADPWSRSVTGPLPSGCTTSSSPQGSPRTRPTPRPRRPPSAGAPGGRAQPLSRASTRTPSSRARPPSAVISSSVAEPDDLGPGVGQQRARRGRRPAGGQHVVDDVDAPRPARSRPPGSSSVAVPYSRS